MKIAKMIDANKDRVTDKAEMRTAPEKTVEQLGLSGFKLVDKLKIINPKSPTEALLDKAAAYFSKVLYARSAGVPVEEDSVKSDAGTDEDDEEDEKMRMSPSSPIDTLVVGADADDDGIVSFQEFEKLQHVLLSAAKNKLPAGDSKLTARLLYKLVDQNHDGEVTKWEIYAFVDSVKNAKLTEKRDGASPPTHSEL